MGAGAQVSLDPAFALAVPGVVAEVELATSAEVVVVVHRPKPHFGAATAAAGLGSGLLTLSACMWTETAIPEVGVLFLVTLGSVVGAGVAHLVQQQLTPAEVRAARALRRARAAFVRYGVHRTRERTGVVVLLDEAERRVAVVVDTGVEGAVPMGLIDAVRFGGGPDGRELDGLQPVLDGLRALGQHLARGLPADPSDNPEELDNAPRVLP